MIKRQYHRWPHPSKRHDYFYNFINSHDPESSIEDELKKYKATLAKSKNKNSLINVKWHDHKLYTLFVMRYTP